VYNEKVKEEKDKDKPKKPVKNQLKAGKQAQNDKIVDDLMPDDDYGDEYDEYQGKGGKGVRV